MYKLFFFPQARKQLKKLHPNDKKRVLAKIELLVENPRNQSLDIKKLANTKNSFRLRTGDLRAIFEIEIKAKIIYIWDINYRGSIY